MGPIRRCPSGAVQDLQGARAYREALGGIAHAWNDGIWRSGRWTHQKCYNDWTASRGGAPSSHKPMWLPKTSSTGRPWWTHGRSWVRPTPRSAHQRAWCPLRDQLQEGRMPATCGDLPSSGAPSRRPTCRRWLKRPSSPCLPRARKPEQPGVVFQHSRRWPPWAGSHNCGGIGYGAYQKHQWIPREIARLEDLTSSNLWVKPALGWGNGRSMRRRFYRLLPRAQWGKSHLYDDPTSPRRLVVSPNRAG